MNTNKSMCEDVVREIHQSEMFQEIQRFLASRFEAIVDEIQTIARIPSPTFSEMEKSRYVRRRFETLKLKDVRIDAVNNASGSLPGKNPREMCIICAHIDTVFPGETELVVREKGDRLYCPSIGDNSASIAGVMALIEAFNRVNYTPPVDVVFLGNTREEGLGDLEGIKYFLDGEAGRDVPREINGVISIDGTCHRLCNRGVGSRRLKVDVTAPGGHSWHDFGSASAVHAIGAAIGRIARLTPPREPMTTFNVGVVNGGSSVNTIAGSASMLIDVRSMETGTLREMEEKIRRRILETMEEFGAACTIEVVGDRPSGFIDDDHPFVRTVLSASALHGLDMTPRASSTDSNIPLSRGVPSITFGIYSGGGSHTVNEYIEPATIQKGLPSAALGVLAILAQ